MVIFVIRLSEIKFVL